MSKERKRQRERGGRKLDFISLANTSTLHKMPVHAMLGLIVALMDSRLMFRILLIYCVFLFILCLVIIKIERMLIMMTVG